MTRLETQRDGANQSRCTGRTIGAALGACWWPPGRFYNIQDRCALVSPLLKYVFNTEAQRSRTWAPATSAIEPPQTRRRSSCVAEERPAAGVSAPLPPLTQCKYYKHIWYIYIYIIYIRPVTARSAEDSPCSLICLSDADSWDSNIQLMKDDAEDIHAERSSL